MVFDYFEDESDDIYLSLSIQCIIYYLYLSLQKKDTAEKKSRSKKVCPFYLLLARFDQNKKRMK